MQHAQITRSRFVRLGSSRTVGALAAIASAAMASMVGCSGSGDASIPGNGDDAGAVVQPGADAGAHPEDGGGDHVPPGDAAGDDRIDPIEVGYAWTYDVSIVGTFDACKAGEATGKVTGAQATGGRDAFQVKSFCPGYGTSSYAVAGDKVELYYKTTWTLLLDEPVADGHTWSNGAATVTWKDVGDVTVPAGTFSRCFNAQVQGSESFTTFCRGVGPVHFHYVEGGNGYDAVLTSKSF